MPRKRINLKVKLDPAGKVLPSLDALLQRSLPAGAGRVLRGIVRLATTQGVPIYLVGGFVRDLFLGTPSLDLDLVVEGDAIRFSRSVVQRFGGRLVAHKKFGTAVWWLPASRAKSMPAFIDFISARTETYVRPAALPTVRFASLSADQARRDFSINTMALCLDAAEAGRLLDPHGGLDDLRHGLLRVLHADSFSDDPTRIFRLLRFAGRLGFAIEAQTMRQLKANLGKIKLLSGERIRNELLLVLLEADPIPALKLMQSRGVLREIHPSLRLLSNLGAFFNRAQRKPPTYWDLPLLEPGDLRFVIWLMHLPQDRAAPVATRLRLSENLKDAVVSASRLQREKDLVGLTPSKLVARLEKQPMLALYALHLAAQGTVLSRRLEAYAKKLRHVQARTDGNALQRAGLKPGPAYKLTLARLRAAWLDGEVRTAQQERALLEELLDEYR